MPFDEAERGQIAWYWIRQRLLALGFTVLFVVVVVQSWNIVFIDISDVLLGLARGTLDWVSGG